MNSYTPLKDVDQKTDMIDHLNQDHPEELLALAHIPHHKDGASQLREVSSAKILDIYEEGVLIELFFSQSQLSEERFIAFEIEGELEDKVLYLAYAAIVQQGRDFSGSRKCFFEVIDKQNVTDNILRLTVKTNTPLPQYYPAHAYAFLLKSMKKRTLDQTDIGTATAKKHWAKNGFDRFFIWLMKHLSKSHRQKLMHNMNKDLRLYTLRKAWKHDSHSSFADRGFIDIFMHDQTPGSVWAQQLGVGDVIMSRSEAKDRHPHLASGRALLIADETAFPALAGIVEQWQNPQAPVVILISSAGAEQGYFSDFEFPAGSSVEHVVCPAQDQAKHVLPLLEEVETIETVWAALESSSAKTIRHYLRNTRKIGSKHNFTKAYWRLKTL